MSIKQKFYSELLDKYFDTEKEAVKAEKDYKDKLEQIRKEQIEKEKQAEEAKAKRALRAKEVEEAFKLVEQTNTTARKLLNEFIRDYGTYHTTITGKSLFSMVFDNFFENLFRF